MNDRLKEIKEFVEYYSAKCAEACKVMKEINETLTLVDAISELKASKEAFETALANLSLGKETDAEAEEVAEEAEEAVEVVEEADPEAEADAEPEAVEADNATEEAVVEEADNATEVDQSMGADLF